MSRHGAQEASAGPLPTAEEVRAALDQVLADGRYAVRPRGPIGEYFDDLMAKIGEALMRIFLGDGRGIEGLAWVLIALIAAACAFGIYLWVRALARGRKDNRRTPSAPAPGAREPSSRECLERARSLAAAGNTAAALAAAYEALLRRLGESGLVHFDASRVARDYLDELARGPAPARSWRPRLARAVALFYPVAFGGRSAAQADLGELLEVAGGPGPEEHA